MRFLIQFFNIEVFYPGSNRYKINETIREQQRQKSIRTRNFFTFNFIPEENKREMDMQKAYI